MFSTNLKSNASKFTNSQIDERNVTRRSNKEGKRRIIEVKLGGG